MAAHHRSGTILVAGLVLAALLPGGTRAAAAAPSGQLNIALSADIPQRDPAGAINNMVASFVFNVFEGLFTPDRAGRIVPLLAQSDAVSADGLTHTLTLRPGVKFQDGSPFTSADVKFTLERALEQNRLVPSRVDISSIASVDADGPDKAVIHLNRPNPILDHSLTSPAALIVPKDYVTRVGDKAFNEHPIGTGPYKFVEAQTGQYTRVEAWDGYWGAPPHIRTITFWAMPEAATQIAALRSGQIDMVGSADPTQTPLLRDFKLVDHPAAEFMWIQFPVKTAALKDVRVRRALNLAVNRQEIVDTIYKGHGVPIATLSGPGYTGYDAGLAPIRYDPEAARKLLAEAGWDTKTVLTLVVPRGRFSGMEQAAQAIISDLGKVGVATRLELVEYNEWLKSLREKTVPGMTVDNFNNRTFDPLGLLFVETSCDGIFSLWCDPEVDSQLKAIGPLGGADRVAAIKKLMLYCYENPAGITLWENDTIYAMKKTVDFKPTPGTYILYGLAEATLAAP